MVDRSIYTTGGTVQAGGGIYLARRADDELFACCREGSFASVLTARQMGKSSLMTRTSERLKARGTRSVIVDLTSLGTLLEAEQWYRGFLMELAGQLDLEPCLVDWWHRRTDLGVTHRFLKFFADVLLTQVREPVVVFVDEIDTTLSLDFTDDFFAAIRAIHNNRVTQASFRRLSFVLLGVATPADLIKDIDRTPFNIGRRVELTDFTPEEAGPLATGFGLTEPRARAVLGWALHWTGGHPYLTQRLCREIAGQERPPTFARDVSETVKRLFIGESAFKDDNLQFVRDMLIRRASNTCEVLRSYQTIRNSSKVCDDSQSEVKTHLKLAGIVKCGRRARGRALVVRNRIYAQVFDNRWITEHLPFSWKRFLQRWARGLAVAGSLLMVPFGILLVEATNKAVLARNEAIRSRNMAIQRTDEVLRIVGSMKRQAGVETARLGAAADGGVAIREEEERPRREEEPRLVYGDGIRALYSHALGPRLSKACRRELAAAGLDLERPLRRAYSVDDTEQFLKIARADLYPWLDDDAAYWQMGVLFMRSYHETTLGAMLRELIGVVGPEQFLLKLPLYYELESNGTKSFPERLGPGDFQVTVSDNIGHPAFSAGLFREGLKSVGARDPTVEYRVLPNSDVVYRIRWTER